MNYSSLNRFIKSLLQNKQTTIKTIGKSVLGKNIYAVLCKKHKNYPWTIITAGIHAREHLSCDLVVKLIRNYLRENIDYGYNVAFVPLVNPDGATLAVNNLYGVNSATKHKLLKINNSADFSLYKANANGVDLNNNFNANWHKKYTNKTQPASQGYYGAKPLSEPETRAMVAFTKKINPFITISYHLKGEEIYFDFFQTPNNYVRDKKIAEVFATDTGYTIKSTQYVSSGGYKDWCVQQLGIPALTIELGADCFDHPYPKSQLKSIFCKNKGVFKCIQNSLKIYNSEKIYETHATSIKPCTKSI